MFSNKKNILPVFNLNVQDSLPNSAKRSILFNGHEMPIFAHAATDIHSVRMIMSQFYVNGFPYRLGLIRAGSYGNSSHCGNYGVIVTRIQCQSL